MCTREGKYGIPQPYTRQATQIVTIVKGYNNERLYIAFDDLGFKQPRCNLIFYEKVECTADMYN